MTTILVTGANGQVGFELAHWLRPHGRVVAIDSDTLDLADPDAIARTMRELSPALVVNAAAYTAVDQAEQERDAAFAINALAPGVLAEEAKRVGSVLVHYSTDYVFDGTAHAPYAEDAPTAPLSVYGASKLEGEQRIAASGADALVLRTSWVYGLRGRNFLLTIRRLAAEREELRIVADQTGVPNWCRALAQATARIVAGGLCARRYAGPQQVAAAKGCTMRVNTMPKLRVTAGAWGLLLLAGATWAQARLEVAPAQVPPTLAAPRSVAGLVAPSAPVRRIDLGVPSVDERAQLAALDAAPVSVRLPANADPAKTRPLAIGFPRTLPSVSRSIGLASLAWQALPAGDMAARIEVVSPGAAAVRLSLAVSTAAPDFVLRLASATPSATAHGPYPAREIAEAVARHGAFWSPVIEGDVAIIEIVARADVMHADIALQLDRVSHLVVEPAAFASIGPKRVQDIGGSGACNVDVACELPDAALEARRVRWASWCSTTPQAARSCVPAR